MKYKHVIFLALLGLSILVPVNNAIAGKQRTMTVTATAYNSMGKNIAAWGTKLKPGMKAIAVSRDLLKKGLRKGTKVKIIGLPGKYTVLDKMHKKWKRRIDIFMGNNVRGAKRWGKRKVKIRW